MSAVVYHSLRLEVTGALADAGLPPDAQLLAVPYMWAGRRDGTWEALHISRPLAPAQRSGSNHVTAFLGSTALAGGAVPVPRPDGSGKRQLVLTALLPSAARQMVAFVRVQVRPLPSPHTHPTPTPPTPPRPPPQVWQPGGPFAATTLSMPSFGCFLQAAWPNGAPLGDIAAIAEETPVTVLELALSNGARKGRLAVPATQWLVRPTSDPPAAGASSSLAAPAWALPTHRVVELRNGSMGARYVALGTGAMTQSVVALPPGGRTRLPLLANPLSPTAWQATGLVAASVAELVPSLTDSVTAPPQPGGAVTALALPANLLEAGRAGVVPMNPAGAGRAQATPAPASASAYGIGCQVNGWWAVGWVLGVVAVVALASLFAMAVVALVRHSGSAAAASSTAGSYGPGGVAIPSAAASDGGRGGVRTSGRRGLRAAHI